MGRHKNPSANTIRMLCSKAAGMCEFEGCNKRLFYDGVTLSEFNNSYVAHIVASSSNGPRGDKVLSPQLSDKLENLMLMCADHHKLIDTPISGPRDFPVEKLSAMKKAHEEKIDRICRLFYVPKTEVVLFLSPIKGVNPVNIDSKNAANAVLPNKQPANLYAININIKSSWPYHSKEYWEDCCQQILSEYNRYLLNPHILHNSAVFSIFPIAPMPLIIKFGELIGDKLPCDVYQKTRYPDTWEWQFDEITNDFLLERYKNSDSNGKIALSISLTNDIQNERIYNVGDYKIIYKIKAKKTGVDCIKSCQDLSAFWHLYQLTMEEILNVYGNKCDIHLFCAMPVSAAFEVGRRYMKGVYPKVTIYDEDYGFFETINIGE